MLPPQILQNWSVVGAYSTIYIPDQQHFRLCHLSFTGARHENNPAGTHIIKSFISEPLALAYELKSVIDPSILRAIPISLQHFLKVLHIARVCSSNGGSDRERISEASHLD